MNSNAEKVNNNMLKKAGKCGKRQKNVLILKK